MSALRGANAAVEFPPLSRLKQCRHGLMLYNVHDVFIGRSLDLYGEYSEGEIDLMRQLVQPGQVVLDVGANIGTHTVWLAQAVGPAGVVLAFEPQRIVHQLLCANLALNSITNVHCSLAALGKGPGQTVAPTLDFSRANNFGGVRVGGDQPGETVPVLTIDGLGLSKCHFLKIDVEEMEQDVLEGAVQTIAAHWPALYVENYKSASLIRFLDGLGYNMFWHKPLLYSPTNFAGNAVNVFGGIYSPNMLCLPKQASQRVEGLKRVSVDGESF